MKRWLGVLLGGYVSSVSWLPLAWWVTLAPAPANHLNHPHFSGFALLAGILGLMLLNFWYAVSDPPIISQITYGPVRFASGITTKSVCGIGFSLFDLVYRS